MGTGVLEHFLIGLRPSTENTGAIKMCNWEKETMMPSIYFCEPCLKGFTQFSNK